MQPDYEFVQLRLGVNAVSDIVTTCPADCR